MLVGDEEAFHGLAVYSEAAAFGVLVDDDVEAVVELSFEDVEVLLANFVRHAVVLGTVSIDELTAVHEVVYAVFQGGIEAALLYNVEIDVDI